jgi:peptide/nickel transport system permease protein
MIITIALSVVMIFFVFRVIPGDPAIIILGTEADEAQIAALRSQLGTDRPVLEQFITWASGALRGDLGVSLRFNRPVAEMLTNRLRVTAPLALYSITLAVLVSIPLGVALALIRAQAVNLVFTYLSQLGMAVPSFWAALLLMSVFGVGLRWIPLGETVDWERDVAASLRALTLPAIAIALPVVAIVTRYVRGELLDQIGQNYMRTALSKGLSFYRAVYHHALRNALMPVTTVLGILFADIVAGTVVVEQVFALPGVGLLLVTAVGYRDFPLIQGIALYIALVVAILNFVVDLLYRVIDPRVRLHKPA